MHATALEAQTRMIARAEALGEHRAALFKVPYLNGKSFHSHQLDPTWSQRALIEHLVSDHQDSSQGRVEVINVDVNLAAKYQALAGFLVLRLDDDSAPWAIELIMHAHNYDWDGGLRECEVMQGHKRFIVIEIKPVSQLVTSLQQRLSRCHSGLQDVEKALDMVRIHLSECNSASNATLSADTKLLRKSMYFLETVFYHALAFMRQLYAGDNSEGLLDVSRMPDSTPQAYEAKLNRMAVQSTAFYRAKEHYDANMVAGQNRAVAAPTARIPGTGSDPRVRPISL